MPRYFLKPECVNGATEVKSDFKFTTVEHAAAKRLLPPRHRLVIEFREGPKAPVTYLDVHEEPNFWARYRDMYYIGNIPFRVLAVKAAVAKKLRLP